MEDHKQNLDVYLPHQGTVWISGSTNPKRAAKCACHFLVTAGIDRIDFYCVGASANQQAMKAMGIFTYMAKNTFHKNVAFQPLRFLTEIKNPSAQKGEELQFLECCVWQTLVLEAPITVA